MSREQKRKPIREKESPSEERERPPLSAEEAFWRWVGELDEFLENVMERKARKESSNHGGQS